MQISLEETSKCIPFSIAERAIRSPSAVRVRAAAVTRHYHYQSLRFRSVTRVRHDFYMHKNKGMGLRGRTNRKDDYEACPISPLCFTDR